MVAAAAAAAADANGSINKVPDLEPISGAGGDDDIVDDDSLNDPYDVAAQQVPQPQVEQELPDSNDDYAKTFDSPIGMEEGEDGIVEPQDVSSLPRKSNEISLSSDHLTNRTSQVSHVVHESSLPICDINYFQCFLRSSSCWCREYLYVAAIQPANVVSKHD
ncbi:hypothetical protein LB503_000643 [Fusarium chuoi]|nr:hypothetical protein LB503_000643 [Fusarium chuoi]